jgi:AcrR family transcriptional regulator
MAKGQKKEQLIATAQSLFFKHSIKRITIEEICRTAGVSKVTFYKHFANKQALVIHIRDKLLDEGFQQFDIICEQDIPYPEKIAQMTQWRIQFFSQMSSEFIEDIFSMDDIHMKIKSRFFKNIVMARERGEIKKEFSPELIWMVTEKLNELVVDGSWKKITLDYSEYQAQMRNLFYHGLLTHHGEPGR